MTYKVRHSAAASCLANCATRDKGASAVSTESTLPGRRIITLSIDFFFFFFFFFFFYMFYIVHATHTFTLCMMLVRRISLCLYLSFFFSIYLYIYIYIFSLFVFTLSRSHNTTNTFLSLSFPWFSFCLTSGQMKEKRKKERMLQNACNERWSLWLSACERSRTSVLVLTAYNFRTLDRSSRGTHTCVLFFFNCFNNSIV